MSARPSDRRRHRRARMELPIRLSTIDPELDPWTGRPYFRASEERSGDVSTGGVFIETPDPLSPGRRVLLELEIPGGRFQAVGRVAWCRAARDRRPGGRMGVGIEFVGARPEETARLERFLAARVPGA